MSDSTVCGAAAFDLKLAAIKPQVITKTDRVRGCYVEDGTLWFNADTSRDSDGSSRKSICRGSSDHFNACLDPGMTGV